MSYIRDDMTYGDLAAWRYRLDDDNPDWWCNAGNTAARSCRSK